MVIKKNTWLSTQDTKTHNGKNERTRRRKGQAWQAKDSNRSSRGSKDVKEETETAAASSNSGHRFQRKNTAENYNAFFESRRPIIKREGAGGEKAAGTLASVPAEKRSRNLDHLENLANNKVMEQITVQDLLSAFKTLGGEKNGRIDYNKISTLLMKKMDLSKNDVESLLESEHCRKDKDFDFLSLCISVISTKETFDRILLENDRPLTGNRRVNSRTFTRRKGSGRSTSSASGGRRSENSDPVGLHTESLKGCIFNTDPPVGLCGNRFLLELAENSGVEIIAQVIDNQGCCNPSPAIEVLMFIENEEPNKKLVTFSSFINAEGYCTIKMNLKKGKYLLVPVTLSWTGEASDPDLEEMLELTEVDAEGETTLTTKCKMALKTIFDCIDVDRNGTLSEIEFDLFIQHICGETAADEWSTVEDNFDTVNGQLTFDGFLSLYKMALVTDFNDVSAMFKKMGLNNALNMEKGLPILLTVTGKVTKPVLRPLAVFTFDSLMEEVFRKTAMEQGHCVKIQNMNDLLLYTHELSHRVTIVIKNQSHSKLKVQLDCRNSENCISHRNSLDFVVYVNPKTSVIGHHLFPLSHGEPWKVQCEQSVIQ